MATVKDIKEKILYMEKCVYNLNSLKECIQDCIRNKKHGENNYYVEAVDRLEDKADLNIHLEILCLDAKELFEKEIARLENIMYNTEVEEW